MLQVLRFLMYWYGKRMIWLLLLMEWLMILNGKPKATIIYIRITLFLWSDQNAYEPKISNDKNVSEHNSIVQKCDQFLLRVWRLDRCRKKYFYVENSVVCDLWWWLVVVVWMSIFHVYIISHMCMDDDLPANNVSM